MGALTFTCLATGANAKEAFDKAQASARYEHGHGGYTGTIAEKHSFTLLPLSAERKAKINAHPHAEDLDHADWQKVDDKWGPAGCYALGDNRFLFFGWASW